MALAQSKWTHSIAPIAQRKLRKPRGRCSAQESGEKPAKAGGSPLQPGETAEEANERRLRESERIEERLVDIDNINDFKCELERNADELSVVEVQSATQCETFDDNDRDGSKSRRMEPCVQLRSGLSRCVRDCDDVNFISVMGDMSEQAKSLCDYLGVHHFPTIQFYKNSELLWQHVGAQDGVQDLSEGILYFGGTAAKGQHASDFVSEIADADGLHDFLEDGEDTPENQLAVVNVVAATSTPCVHIFPAVFALAKSMGAQARFARLIADSSEEARSAAKEMEVQQVPTFLFFRRGKQVGRSVSSSRGDLVGKILQLQGSLKQ